MGAHAAREMAAPPEFDDVYEAHIGFVWRTLAGLGVPESELEDAAQETFLVVHRRLDEFEGRAAITTWLFAIARRIAADRARRRSRHHRPIAEDINTEPPPSPSELTERAQARALLLELLDVLDADKREVFVLVEIEQVPVKEVAAMLGLKLNTAWSRLRLARRAFEREVQRRRAGSPGKAP